MTGATKLAQHAYTSPLISTEAGTEAHPNVEHTPMENGLEAWTRLVQRFDPPSTHANINLMSNILTPPNGRIGNVTDSSASSAALQRARCTSCLVSHIIVRPSVTRCFTTLACMLSTTPSATVCSCATSHDFSRRDAQLDGKASPKDQQSKQRARKRSGLRTKGGNGGTRPIGRRRPLIHVNIRSPAHGPPEDPRHCDACQCEADLSDNDGLGASGGSARGVRQRRRA